MEADGHTPDAACFAALIQCLGSSYDKKDYFLSSPFVMAKLEAFERSGMSLLEVAQKEGVFPLKKDLDLFMGKTTDHVSE